MDKQTLIKQLGALAQFDVDIAQAYSHAIDQIGKGNLHYNLTRFRQDHERHLARISSHIRDLGGEPPEHARDLKGLLMEGVAALSGIAGRRGLLEAMRSNEKWIHERYDEARTLDVPPEIRSLLEEHHSDETEHLNYLSQAIRHQYWRE
jgi:hypothetical protein